MCRALARLVLARLALAHLVLARLVLARLVLARLVLARLVLARLVLARLVLALLILLGLSPPSNASGASGTPAAATTQWSWPLAGTPSVIRGFDLPTEPWLAGHRGVDLLSSPGAPVRAAGAGQVTFAGWVGGLPVVAVTHPDGRRTTYQPVIPSVARGAPVPRGAILGRISAGGSHCLPQACLHWGLREADGTYVDPLSVLGVDQQVRLLPVWTASGSPPSTVRVRALGASKGISARIGALNRARASPWLRLG
jgi:Peptidase family M23